MASTVQSITQAFLCQYGHTKMPTSSHFKIKSLETFLELSLDWELCDNQRAKIWFNAMKMVFQMISKLEACVNNWNQNTMMYVIE